MSTPWMSYSEYVSLRFVSAVEQHLLGYRIWGKVPTDHDRARAAQAAFAELEEKEQAICRPLLTHYIPTDVNP